MRACVWPKPPAVGSSRWDRPQALRADAPRPVLWAGRGAPDSLGFRTQRGRGSGSPLVFAGAMATGKLVTTVNSNFPSK